MRVLRFAEAPDWVSLIQRQGQIIKSKLIKKNFEGQVWCYSVPLYDLTMKKKKKKPEPLDEESVYRKRRLWVPPSHDYSLKGEALPIHSTGATLKKSNGKL